VTKRLAVVLVAATALAAAGPASVPASHGTSCGVVSKGSSDYRVTGRVIACRSARKWVRRYLRDRGKPSGWSCVNPAGSVLVYCSRGSKAYWATRL
jgi:xanthine/CO dehydrogenase XdhC/CoxF family maturation factor